jgi:hypothetical protein
MSDRVVLVGGVSIIAAALLYSFAQNGTGTVLEKASTVANANNSNISYAPLDGDNYPSEIKDELHSRVKTFFSEEGFQKLQNSFIVVSKEHCSSLM